MPCAAPTPTAACPDHDHDHDHDHGPHHDHDHGHGHGHDHGDASERRLSWAFAIIVAFMGVEAVGGVLAHSLALIADAGHMFADAGALALSIAALRVARRPANQRYSYGHERYQVLAAFVNGLALLLLSVWIVYEAVIRLLAPTEVAGWTMLIVAALGLAANVGAFLVLSGASSLNERGALAHVLSDLLGSAGAMAAAGVILATGWMPIDPILSALVSVLILRSGWHLTRESAHVLLEGTPRGFDISRVEAELVGNVPGVCGVHHVHAWSLNGEQPMLTLHAEIDFGIDRHQTLAAIHHRLEDRLGISHVTVQIEEGHCVQTRCSPTGSPLPR